METIGELTADRVEWLTGEFARMGWTRLEGHFAKAFEAQGRGEMVVLVARAGEELLGGLTVLWSSDYAPFRERMVPEIHDLYVTPANRRKGVASRLMDRAEEVVRARSSVIGIAVGLHPGYGPAQRMYALRGYVPDGNALTYRNEFVVERQQVILDDDLVMHLTKEF